MKHIKIVAVGDGAVGKTCLLIAYAQGTFPEEYIPTIFDNYSQSTTINGQNLNLQLWDTAGQEDYAKLRPMSYPDTDVFLICFSLISPTSLENITALWKPEVSTNVPNAEIVLVGLKKDLRDDFEKLADELKSKEPGCRPITAEEGQKVANEIGARKYMECSARTFENINAVFEEAALTVLKPINKADPEEKKGCILI